MAFRPLLALGLAITAVSAQVDTSLSFTNSFSVISTTVPSSTGSQYVYTTVTGQSTVVTTMTAPLNGTATGALNGTALASNATSSSRDSQITVSPTSYSLTVIAGSTHTSNGTSTSNSGGTSTSTSARPTNTVPCNGFPEFCSRKYSNISNVCSHNSAFVKKNNAASNQQLPILNQLYDGVRMLQGETHLVNNTIYNCHTECSLLNAGTFQAELEVVNGWLRDNPYEVLTILISNSDFVDVEHYVAPITNSGLLNYVYEPAYIPQYRDQWPTLGEMILRNKRVVFFMDYMADQAKVPYILDQYSHIWETPFSPQDRNFPCTIGRPPDLNETLARDQLMYLANHNLNQAIDVSAILGTNIGTILIPNTAELNNTNADGLQIGQATAMVSNCTQDWGRPPNFLVVDYYNIGSPEAGSVFHTVAKANGVVYTRDCCGVTTSAAAPAPRKGTMLAAVMAAAMIVGVALSM